jgi:cobalt-zinc-cadmium efflux system outer membrane protein
MSIFSGFDTHGNKNSISPADLNTLWRSAAAALCVIISMLAPPSILAQTASGGVVELDDAIAEALANSLELAGINAESEALIAASSQVASLPDPVLSLNAMNLPTDTFDLGQEAMTQMQVGLSQRFPFPGKRDLRRDAVDYQVTATNQLLIERRTAIVGEVRSAWWRLISLDRALQIVEQNKDLMRNFVAIAQTKYKVGNGIQQDVLLAQLELSRLLERELRIRGMRRSGQAELNGLMNRPPDRVLALPAVLSDTSLPELQTERQLLQQAGSERALINVHRDLIDSAQANLELAEKDRRPDIKLGVGYGFRQGFDPLRGVDRPDLLSVMISIDVPIFSGSKQTKAVEQRTHELSRQTLKMRDTLRVVEVSVSRNLASYLSARDQVLLLETAIIPQAQQTVSSMLAGYQVNQVDFLSLVNTQITLYNAQINYWESLSEAKQSLARLASAVGVEALYE